MGFPMLQVAIIIALLGQARGLSGCDNEAGQVCPASVGKEIGECLQDPTKHQLTDIDGNPRDREPGEQPMELSQPCKAFIKINDACAAEIDEHCQSMFYHGDTMTCLTTWTKPEVLGDACKASLPKAASDEEDVDAEKAAWRAARKAARTQAMKDIEKEQKGSEKKKKKRKKSKKEL